MTVADVSAEFADCEFYDERLTKRVQKLAEALGWYPNVSIPAAFRTKADMEACYLFFDNEKVSPERILEPHFELTHQRIRERDFVLLVQDTTELDLTRPAQQVVGAGPMDCSSRRGAFHHPMLAYDADGVPLGLVGQKSWVREELAEGTKAEKNKRRKATPIEEKESYRWLEGLVWAERTAAACPETICVCVGDSESDIYDIFVAASKKTQDNLELLVRAGQNRNTTDGEDWADHVRRTEKIGNQTVTIRASQAKIGTGKSARSRSRESRVAELEIRKAVVELRRPIRGNARLPATMTVHVVLCEEVAPPDGQDPISWMLVTTLPIATNEDVQRIISAYCVRWQIEVYFKTLKSGCLVEHRRFENIDRVLNCVAFYSVVAWRVMHVCYLGRECPEIDCEVIFQPSEWKSVYAILKLPLPASGNPTLNELVRAIARLGGFIDRPKNHPGTQTLWIGLQRTYDLSSAWDAFGPGAKKLFCPTNLWGTTSPLGEGWGEGARNLRSRQRHPHPACGRPLPEGEAKQVATSSTGKTCAEQDWASPRPVNGYLGASSDNDARRRHAWLRASR